MVFGDNCARIVLVEVEIVTPLIDHSGSPDVVNISKLVWIKGKGPDSYLVVVHVDWMSSTVQCVIEFLVGVLEGIAAQRKDRAWVYVYF